MRYIISMLLMLILSWSTFACDICGGITTPGTDGLLNGNQFHFIGIRANYANFRSLHTNSFSQDVIRSEEHFLRLNLTGRWQFAKKFNLQANIPFHSNWQFIPTGDQHKLGLGDITLHTNWTPLYKKNEKGTSNTLVIGLGIKFPTGSYASDPWKTSNLSPGSGSWDPLLNLNYRLGKGKFGFLLENAFSYKTANKSGYKYGSAFSSGMSFLYTITTKQKHKILPSLGSTYQFTGTDRINGYLVAQSFNAGHIVNAEVGLNLLTTNWMFNTKLAYPIYQSIVGGDVTSRGTITLGIHYLIQKK